jgi:hypothetical protein
MNEIHTRRHEYDIPTAVTFLIAGLGLGSVLTLLFASRFEKALDAGAVVKDSALTREVSSSIAS